MRPPSWPFSIVLLAMSLAGVAPALSQGEPPGISRARTEAMQECREAGGGRARFTANYLRRVNISPDGVDDYILDNGGIDCPGALGYFCGSGGCSMELHVSTPTGHRRIELGTARGVRVESSGARQVVVLELHGSACGRMGAALCTRRQIWNGTDLVPLSTGR